MPAFARAMDVVHTSYSSDTVDIPADFLTMPASDCEPIQVHQINFAQTDLPEYDGAHAVVLDNVLSPYECAMLLVLAERSAASQGWRPAMLNAGIGFEALVTEHRNSDRIIWDSKELVSRLWDRICTAPGVEEKLHTIEGNDEILSARAIDDGQKWQFSRVNERMRYLRYRPGQYFKRHCDGSYETDDEGKLEKTFYTLHLYLNQEEDELKGGATTFHESRSMWSEKQDEKRLDVESKVGRVLIFQHRRLLHSGDDVLEGVKHTMRTDLLFERVN